MAPKQKPGRSRQDYRTPPNFLAAVLRRFGLPGFAIDLAASEENTVAPLYYSEADNALTKPWRTKSRELAWLNPPFSQIGPWVQKACQEGHIGARVAMLVPAGVGANWWRDYVHGHAFALLLNGRITFVGETTPYPKDCCLLLYGPDVAPGYDVWNWGAQTKALPEDERKTMSAPFITRLYESEVRAVARGEVPPTLRKYCADAVPWFDGDLEKAIALQDQQIQDEQQKETTA